MSSRNQADTDQARSAAESAPRHGAPSDQELSDVARVLQRGLAPEPLPEAQGWEMAARYRASGAGDVGGDWYDVLQLAGDEVAVVIGDVNGRGVSAATTMAQVRHAARAYLVEDSDPATTLRRLNRLLARLLPGEVVTVLVVLIAGAQDVTAASAGHLPPLVVGRPSSRFWDVGKGPALGLSDSSDFHLSHHALAPSSALVVYTDGLVERRGEPIDAGLDRLARAGDTARDFASLCDHLIAAVAVGDDDLAVLAMRPEGNT